MQFKISPIILFFQCFLSLLLCYSSAISIYLSFIKNRHFDFFTVFFTLTLVFLCLFSLWQNYQVFRKPTTKQNSKARHGVLSMKKIKKNKKQLALIILCLINLSVGFFSVYTQYPRTPAMPEIYQSFSLFHSNNAMRDSYRQQQPPLDYYFSFFSNELWGKGKFAMRFHAMMFYLILSLILPLMLWFFCSCYWSVALGSVLFSVNHVIRLHAVNGRPVSLTLLTGFLFLFFYMAYCKNNQPKKRNLFFPMLATQYLFIMSIGLQPVIFIISLFISSFYLLIKNKKRIFQKLFLSHILTAVLTLPVYINMYLYGKDFHKFKKFSMESISSYIEDYNLLHLFKKYFYPFYEQILPSFLMLGLGLMALIFTQRKISNLTAQTGIALITFPLLFDFLFKTVINWSVSNWYFIVWSLFLIFFCVLVLNDILQYLKEKTWKYTYLFIPVVFLFVWNSSSQISAIKKESRFWNPYRDSSNEEKVYEYLKKKGEPKDIFIEFSLMQPSDIQETSLNNLAFFLHKPNTHPIASGRYSIQVTKTPPFFNEKATDYIPYINWKNIPEKEDQKIFFVTINNTKENKAHSVFSGFLEEKRIGRFSIFEQTFKTGNREKEYKKFLMRLMKKTPEKYQSVLYETLLFYACKKSNKNYFNRLLKKYRTLEPFLDKSSNDMDPPYRFALNRRANLFKIESYCNN